MIIFSFHSTGLAAFIGGMTYWLYTPAMIIWSNKFSKKSAAFEANDETNPAEPQ